MDRHLANGPNEGINLLMIAKAIRMKAGKQGPNPEKKNYENKGALKLQDDVRTLIRKMPKYRVARNRLATAVIHVDTYLTILGLIERELQRPDLDNNERIRLRSAHLEFQRLFYAGRNNGPPTVRRDLQIREGWEDTSE